MKNRKTTLLAFMLIALLCVGIGFATLTDSLEIAGGINVKVHNGNGEEQTPVEEEWDGSVYFNNAQKGDVTGTWEKKDGVGNYDITISGAETDTATISIPENVLSVKGDAVTFTIDIKNDNTEYDAEITMPTVQTVTSGNGTFTVTVTQEQSNYTVPAEGSLTFTITVEVTKTPTENVSSVGNDAATFTLSFTATTAEKTAN